MNFRGLEPASSGRENVLVLTDVVTKFTVAVLTRDQCAWYMSYSLLMVSPKEFPQTKENNLRLKLKEMCCMYAIKKSWSTPTTPKQTRINYIDYISGLVLIFIIVHEPGGGGGGGCQYHPRGQRLTLLFEK